MSTFDTINPKEIEHRSLAAIAETLEHMGKTLKKEHEAVIKRVIHTTADFDYADNLLFSENAVTIGTNSLKSGCIIVTDTKMAMAGVNKGKLRELGCEIHCFISDEDVAEQAKAKGITRAAVSMEKAAHMFGKTSCPVIFAIGNAPTALIKLRELIQDKKMIPSLIIAVPVGFVNVVESKELIVKEKVPYIAAMGRKGGSNVAAAILNAMLYSTDMHNRSEIDAADGGADAVVTDNSIKKDMFLSYSEDRLEEYIHGITAPDRRRFRFAEAKWNLIAKPIKGMGVLEENISKIYSIWGETGGLKKCVAVLCADNGIVAEGVTQTDSSVTAVVARNITVGKASVTNMAKVAGADVYAFDVGMLEDVEGVISKKCGYGTDNFLKKPAMSREKAVEALIKGIEIAKELKDKGYHIIACGEMGIGNTTTSSAIVSVLFSVEAERVTGKGAGLEKDKIYHKAQVIQKAIELHRPDKRDMIDILSKVGGYDIAAMCGLFLGGAVHKIPILIDGYISGVAALMAKKMCELTTDYMIASHMSAEPASQMVMSELGLSVPLRMDMALGEGTGAVALMPILDMALRVFQYMPTFEDINIEEYKEYEE